MKKILLSSIILISLSACFQKNEKNNEININSESKNVSVDSKLVIENYEKLIFKYKTTGEEDWLNIISANLIFIGEIETNRNQSPSERMGGAYQCNLSTRLIRLTDGKKLIYSDIFSVKEDVVVKAILKYLKDSKINFDESELELTNESLVEFYTLNNYQFSLIDSKSIAESCDLPLFGKEIPIHVISPYLTKWMKQQLQVFN